MSSGGRPLQEGSRVQKASVATYVLLLTFFFLAIFRTVRVSRVRNRALYHSEGFGLFVEIESMKPVVL